MTVKFDDCKITANQALDLHLLTDAVLAAITSLSLESNMLCDAGVQEVAKALPRMLSLNHLSLEDNNTSSCECIEMTDRRLKRDRYFGRRVWNADPARACGRRQ